MAQKNFGRSRSGRPVPSQNVWAIAHENMGIGQNSHFLVVKCKQMRNGHGGAVTMVS